MSRLNINCLKERQHSREKTFFAFTPINIHLRAKCVFNIGQITILSVLTLLSMFNIEVKLKGSSPSHSKVRFMQSTGTQSSTKQMKVSTSLLSYNCKSGMHLLNKWKVS